MRASLMEAVRDRWPRAETFYAERDDRTVRLVQGLPQYSIRPVEIILDPDEVDLPTGQRLLLVAANLMARWARHVRIVSADATLAPALRRDGFTRLRERVLGEMQLADPFGDFQWSPGNEDGVKSDSKPLRLLLGRWRGIHGRALDPDDYFVHASGWTALGWRGRVLEGEFSESAAIPAAALAASIGVADVFKRAVGHRRKEWLPDFAWSTWSQEFVTPLFDSVPWSDPPAGGDVIPWSQILIAGVGAIGSALVYLADLGEPEADVTLLDRDHVVASNLNRSPLFTVEHVLQRIQKTEAAARYLKGHGVSAAVLSGGWDELSEVVRGRGFSCWVSLTNEEGAWASVPFQEPPVIVHGTTTSGWGFCVGRHIPGSDDCTYCRMPRPRAEFRGPCATGDISPEPTVPIRASLPFLSVASAALLLAELWKVGTYEGRCLPNDVAADLQNGLPGVIALHRRATRRCPGCRAASLSRSASDLDRPGLCNASLLMEANPSGLPP